MTGFAKLGAHARKVSGTAGAVLALPLPTRLTTLTVLTVLVFLTLVSACVMVPVTHEVYDPDCQSMRRQIVLEPAVMGQFQACGGRECSALLVAMGAVTAASVVVSGSIAVAGNVAYWAEHKANCKRNTAAPVPAPSTAPSGASSPAGTGPGFGVTFQPPPAPTVPANSTNKAPAPP